jgi:hypothetical protein
MTSPVIASAEPSTFYSAPDINIQDTKTRVLQETSTIYPTSRKPFPPSSETQYLLTFKLFPPIENVGPGKPFSPFENVKPETSFAPSQDGNKIINQVDDDNNIRNDLHEAVAVDKAMVENDEQKFMEPEQEQAFLELFKNLLEAKGQHP